jgi:DnaJ-class molecular chaperone
MTNFERLNYYEILDIPIDASSFEILRAYRNALEYYSEGSLLTYSLFSDRERANILKKIEKAYNTLSDRTKRVAYDASLSDKSTFEYSQKGHNPSRASRSKPRKECIVTRRNEAYLTASGESKTHLTSQISGVEARGGISSISANSASEDDIRSGIAEKTNPSKAGSFWSQILYKMILVTSLFVLIFLILGEILLP